MSQKNEYYTTGSQKEVPKEPNISCVAKEQTIHILEQKLTPHLISFGGSLMVTSSY